MQLPWLQTSGEGHGAGINHILEREGLPAEESDEGELLSRIVIMKECATASVGTRWRRFTRAVSR